MCIARLGLYSNLCCCNLFVLVGRRRTNFFLIMCCFFEGKGVFVNYADMLTEIRPRQLVLCIDKVCENATEQ